MKKKRIFIVLVIFSIVSVLFILFSLNNNKTDNIGITKNNIQSTYQDEFKINFSVPKEDFNFPPELPNLTSTQSPYVLTQNKATNIANNLGFLGEPTILNDEIEGTCYFWKNENKTLFAFANGGKIRYSTGAFVKTQNKSLSDLEISTLATTFISENNILEEGSFTVSEIKYLNSILNGEGFQDTSRSNATLFRISVLPKDTKYQLVALSSVKPSSYIEYNQDGSVYSFQISPLFIKEGDNIYNLLNYDEVTSLINESKLIELNGETYLLSDLSDGTIKSVDITEIKIGYLIESSNQISYNPIYILSGKATVNDAQHPYFATLYLSAIKEN